MACLRLGQQILSRNERNDKIIHSFPEATHKIEAMRAETIYHTGFF